MEFWKVLGGYFVSILLGGFLNEFLKGIIPQTSNGKIWIIIIWFWSRCDFWIIILCMILWTIFWVSHTFRNS